MGFKKAADGVAKKGKTDVQIFPSDGPTAPNPRGGKGGKGGKSGTSKGGKTDADMLSMGRGLAKVAAQKRG